MMNCGVMTRASDLTTSRRIEQGSGQAHGLHSTMMIAGQARFAIDAASSLIAAPGLFVADNVCGRLPARQSPI